MERIYLAYLVTTRKHEDGNETQETDLVKAFSNKEFAKEWAKNLFAKTEQNGYKFYWTEREDKTSYEATLSEYWDDNKQQFTEQSAEYTIKWEAIVKSVEVNDDTSDPEDDVMGAMYG